MPFILNKYKILSEISTFSNIKTYSTQAILILKEIIPKNKDDYLRTIENLEMLFYSIKHYKISV